MRIFVPVAALLLLGACGTTPVPVVTPTPVPATQPRESGPLIGLDAGALTARLGQPRLRIREGDSTKLQFARGDCLVDAYLYPGVGGGSARVTHIDTRNRDGRVVAQAECLRLFDGQ